MADNKLRANRPPLELLRQHVRALQEEFNTFLPFYRDVQEYIVPERGRYLGSDNSREVNNGYRKDMKIVTGAATKAVADCAAGMQSGKTPKSREWFTIKVNERYARNNSVNSFNSEVMRRIFDLFDRSNLYNALLDVYEELLTFETAAVAELSHPTKCFHFRSFTMGEYLFSTDNMGEVDTFILKENMTTSQMLDEYGYDALSPRVKNMLDRGDYNTRVKVNVAVLRKPSMFNVKIEGFPIAEVHYEADTRNDADQRKFLAIRGYHEFPVFVVRWSTVSNDSWGKGPSRLAIADIKQLQMMDRDKLKGLRKLVDPPLQGPMELEMIGINASPGGFTPVSDPNNMIRPLYGINPDLNSLQNVINETIQKIKGYYFNDLFLTLATRDIANQSAMTAREVEERSWEKMLLLGPVLERIDHELLNPLIVRSINMMERDGLLPEVPPEVFNANAGIEYNSILSQSQKAVGVRKNENLIAYIGGIAGVCPSAPQAIDWYKALKNYALGVGAEELLLPEEQYKQALAQQQQQMQAMQQAQMGAQMADAGKTASEIDTKNLAQLAQEIGGGMGNV